MPTDHNKDYAKQQLENYLAQRGINTRKNFLCLNPEHNEKNPSMSFDSRRNKAHCFACGADYDIFDVVGIDFNITDTKEKFKKTYEVLGLTDRAGTKGRGEQRSPEKASEIERYITKAHERLLETDYITKRGISKSTAARFKLGYDPNYPVGGGRSWQALIIPTSKNSYTARNMDKNASKEDRVRKQGSVPIFNIETALEKNEAIFVVEGEIDAMSLVEIGANAIALGGVANTRRLIQYFESMDKKPEQPILIALDNDTEGERAALRLIDGLKNIGMIAHMVDIAPGFKDANEILKKDRDGFIAAVERAKNFEEQAKALIIEKYRRNSAAYHLDAFRSGIAKSASTPAISTGFEKLDRELEGGLYEGLYICGAISSLGKTTFITQIADQIAKSGTDVLIFSLEMARHELMAKSISRITLTSCLDEKINVNNAKTTRGITVGGRYQSYSVAELELIENSIEKYGEFAGNLYIHEGIGDIGVSKIRETVALHTEITGNSPVVIIDYIQILAPYNERFTDKQNMDKAVLELKRLSRDYKIPVIGVSSFNRHSYRDAVTMEAFKESGAIEYSSDVLLGLQLSGAGESGFDANEEKRKYPRELELVVLKNRNGATGGRVEFKYYTLFNYWKE